MYHETAKHVCASVQLHAHTAYTMPTDPFRLDGQSVLITGAGGGIGRALVARFAAAGASVIGADRGAAAMTGLDVADQLHFDLADSRATSAAISSHLDRHGPPDVVVSNAGFTRAETFEDLDIG